MLTNDSACGVGIRSLVAPRPVAASCSSLPGLVFSPGTMAGNPSSFARLLQMDARVILRTKTRFAL